MRVVHICMAREVDGKFNLRTRAGREREVFAQVEQFGGFTVFWATANQARANALQRLIDEGQIATQPEAFPWTKARRVEPAAAPAAEPPCPCFSCALAGQERQSLPGLEDA